MQIAAFGILLPLLGNFIASAYLESWKFAHEPFHAVIESIGGVIAIIIVFILYLNEKYSKVFGSKLIWIASALISMGVLDIVHGSVLVGKSFVWLHSTATFFGGLFFGLIWIPEKLSLRLKKLPIFVFLGTIAFASFCIISPDSIPAMVVNKEFTPLAKGLNIVGGLGFILACIYFIKNFVRLDDDDDGLLAAHCLLFGSAGILFELSTLWDANWWWWHLLRLIAYTVLIYFFYKTFVEVSDGIKKSKEEIEGFAKELQHSEARIQAIVDSTVDGIITINENGVIQSFNKACEGMFGYSMDQVVGKNVSILMPEPHASRHDGYLNSYLKGGPCKVMGIGRDTEGLHKNGNTFPIHLSVGEITLKDEKIFTGVIRDISQQQEIERNLKESKEVAEKANIAKSEFLANMSHELRTPMHAIIGFCDLGLMSKDEWKNEDYVGSLEEIKDSSNRLLTLLNSLLDLSKLESGSMGFDFKENDLLDIAEKSITSLQPLIDAKKLNIIMDAESSIAECDSAKILQVLTNLLANAIKFTPEGKNIFISTKEDTLQSRRKSDTDLIPAISLSITDEGVGIPTSELSSIFDKFIQSSKTSTGAGGTGLGLAICKEIVEAHHGKIWAEITKDGKTKLTFTIPMKQIIREKRNG